MLVLTRKLGESVNIGEDIKVTFLDIRGKYIRIGIDAPRDVAVHRQEVYQLMQEKNLAAAKAETNESRELPDKLQQEVKLQEE
jgi:carbon storage regulator